MILQRLCVLFCSACFIIHSILNLYKNFANVKTVDYTWDNKLSEMKFPLSIQVYVDPGFLDVVLYYLCNVLINKLSEGLNLSKVKDYGLVDSWDFYLANHRTSSVQAFRNKNISGKAFYHLRVIGTYFLKSCFTISVR